MNWKKFLIATLAVGVVVNVLDMIVQGGLFTSMFYSKAPQLFRQDFNLAAVVIGDFVAAAVLVWFYNRVLASFGTGLMNGAKFGFYAGVFLGFPMFIFNHLMLVGYSYGLAWASTIYAVVWCKVAGAVAGLVYEKVS
jgi:hypothetical protein